MGVHPSVLSIGIVIRVAPLLAASLLLSSASAAAADSVVLTPLAECSWSPQDCPSLVTRSGSRAAILYALGDIDPLLITSLTLEIGVQPATGASQLNLHYIDAIGRPGGSFLDPFIHTTVRPAQGPCDGASPGSCSAVQVPDPDNSGGSGRWVFFDSGFLEPAQVLDVSAATAALSGSDAFLQLSLIPEVAPGTQDGFSSVQFRHSGFGGTGPLLTVTFVPEPSTALLLMTGLVPMAMRRRRP